MRGEENEDKDDHCATQLTPVTFSNEAVSGSKKLMKSMNKKASLLFLKSLRPPLRFALEKPL
jgi:hypothetical protein